MAEAPALSELPLPEAAADPGFAVYVHWPFCLAKCPYCDFNSHVARGAVDEDDWRDALLAELAWFAGQTPKRPVRSVFFGGGTPSLMAPGTVAATIDAVERHFGFEADPEITLEANPTSVEAGRFAGYRASGVNRLSLGVQALDDAALARLGRQHSAAEALTALDIARARFERVSFDLIYARPGQSLAGWRAELARALAIAPEHVSLYQLTLEPGTRFFDWHAAGRLEVPDADVAADLYEATQEEAEAAGLPAYEISNHARPGAECRHNLVYWQGGAWVGIGPGAHGRLGEGAGRRALATERDPARWLRLVRDRGHGAVTDEALTASEAADELLVTALRTEEGLDLARHAALGGRLGEAATGDLVREGLAARDASRLRLTPRGRLVANAAIAALAG